MNCCWCGANADGSDSHGICDACALAMELQSAWRQLEKTPSYVDSNIAVFSAECEQILSQEVVGVAS